MREASGKSLRGLDMQPGESEGHRAWWLTLVCKESKYIWSLQVLLPFLAKEKGGLWWEQLAHQEVYGTKEPNASFEPEWVLRKVAGLELPSKGHVQVVTLQSQVTPTPRIRSRISQRVHLLCQGTVPQKNTSHVPHRGLQSHMTTLVTNFTPSLPLPHPTVTEEVSGTRWNIESKNTTYILFPVQVSEPVSGWELWGRDEERIFKLNYRLNIWHSKSWASQMSILSMHQAVYSWKLPVFIYTLFQVQKLLTCL